MKRGLRAGLLILFFFLVGCTSERTPETIGDIAYGSRYSGENIVYVEENDVFVPFLVVDGDFGGNTLLLRQDILPHHRRISNYSSYYENSEIDTFLNTEYLTYISLPMTEVVLTEIAITTDDSIGYSGSEIKTIQRKVFLLSLNEIGISDLMNAGPEGETIEYFRNENNWIAYSEGGVTSWWLRTPNTYYLSCTYGMGANGKIGSGNAYDANGIRPALCVPSSTPIMLNNDVVQGKTVYVFQKTN